jgi:phosphotransferase system HPr (HPr) family protein
MKSATGAAKIPVPGKKTAGVSEIRIEKAAASRMICRIMVEVNAVIKNEAGIHCRPTALLTQAAAGYKGTITVIAPAGTCHLGSALELMILGLEQGTQITIQAEGPDEAAAAAKFKELFETEFDFPNAGQ